MLFQVAKSCQPKHNVEIRMKCLVVMVIKAVPVEVKVKKVLYFSDLLLAVW